MKKLYSESFIVGGYEWRILIFPEGNKVDCLSMYLDFANSATLPHGWSIYAVFELAVVNQVQDKYTLKREIDHQFNQSEKDWGFTSFMTLGDLTDPSKGYTVNDTCVFEANVCIELLNAGLWLPNYTNKEKRVASCSTMPVSQEAAGPSGSIEIDGEIKELFMDMDDLVDTVVVKPETTSSSDQAREKLKALLALDLGDVAERRGEIIGWASILSSTSADVKKLLRDLVTTTVFESFLMKKSEAADLEQKLSKRQVVAEAFLVMPKTLESLKSVKQLADDNVSAHERMIKECEDEIENLQKKIAHHKEQLLEARHLSEESKETFQAERDRAAKLKEELVATKDSATSWKEAHAAALAKAEELKKEWAIFVQNHSVI